MFYFYDTVEAAFLVLDHGLSHNKRNVIYLQNLYKSNLLDVC